MELDILENNKYISANLASGKTGYTSDYIGQLCRLGKIPSKLSGRTWYLDLNSLINHKKNRQFGRRRKTTPLVFSRTSVLEGNSFSYNFLKDTTFHYVNDDRPIFPELAKISLNEVSFRGMTFTMRIMVLTLSTVVVLGIGNIFDRTFSSNLAQALSSLERLLDPIDSLIKNHTDVGFSEFATLLWEAIGEVGTF